MGFQNKRTYENQALKNMHMPSREKYIFHMLFSAFHNTSRVSTLIMKLMAEL